MNIKQISKGARAVLDGILDTDESPKLSPARLRKLKSDGELKAKGGSIAHIRLSPKATAILLSLANEYGGKTQAIEQILSDYEQRSLL